MADPRQVDLTGCGDVHKGSELAGHLVRDGSLVRWQPDPAYRGPDVATSIPADRDVQQGGAGAVPPFFAGLLPEGRRLQLLQQRVKASADDELAQLLVVGGDTVGDVRVFPHGESPASVAPRFDPSDASSSRFSDLLPSSVGPLDKVALPGVQPKLSARLQTVPVRSGHPQSDAILKLETDDLPGLVRNEAACLAAARRAGLEAAEAEVLTDQGGRSALLVRRFDRHTAGGGLVAVAQEDACQVLRLWPADKYRVTTEAAIAALAEQCAAPRVAALRLWEQVAFSYLVGNGDQHAKNLSIGWGQRGWEPTPVYDVICSLAYGDHTLALSVDGSTDAQRLSRVRLLAAAEGTGVPAPAMARVLDRLLERTGNLPDLLSRLHLPTSSPRKLARILAARRQRLSPTESP